MNDQQPIMQAEFDSLAKEYTHLLDEAVALSGESSEYFAEYKIADLAKKCQGMDAPLNNILDFGSGIGNSVPYFRKYFVDSSISCAEVSQASIDFAKARFPGNELYLKIDDSLNIDSNSYDIVFSACVFHHIPPSEHSYWLKELYRVLKPGGILAIYEHNPLNPLTVLTVKTSPLDVNAKLIFPRILCKQATKIGFVNTKISYKLFFPKFLSLFKFLEKYMGKLCFGAQYSFITQKPS